MHQNLGNVFSQTDRAREAEAEFQTVIGICGGLRGQDADWQRQTLAVCHYMVGTLKERSNDTEAAILAYREAARSDGDRVGAAIIALGRLESSAGRHGDAVTTFRRAAALDLTDPRGPAGLAEILIRAARPTEAVAPALEAIARLERRVAAEPGNAQHGYDLARSLLILGDAYLRTGFPAKARDVYSRAVAIAERSSQDHGDEAQHRNRLASCLRHRALALRDLGETAGARANARKALSLLYGLPSRSGAEWFETSCCHAVLSGLAARDGSDDSEAESAMALLAKAVATGYRDLHSYRTESALDPLRNRPAFQRLIMDLTFPPAPLRGDTRSPGPAHLRVLAA